MAFHVSCSTLTDMRLHRSYLLWFLLLIPFAELAAQGNLSGTRRPGQSNTGIAYDSQGRPIRRDGKNDSLQTRNSLADSITIFYRYFDSTRIRRLDSSLNDFSKWFPLPYDYHTLGNYGTAAQSLLFTPFMKPGFDAGFHQYDIYKFTNENTRFFETTRPYTELAYILGAKAEQLINIVHTQNRKDRFNFSIEYRFSNAPGQTKNQNASHNNFRFTSHYRSPNRKYELFLIFLSNKVASAESGGLRNVKLLDSLSLNDPYELETRLGKSGALTRNPFNTSINTGNLYQETGFLFRHHLDFGSKDSLVTDSTTYRIFYPRFRIEHTLRINSNSYWFFDNFPDSARYRQYFNKTIHTPDTISYKDAWTDITNEFSLLSFPDKKNQSQFLKAGIALQNLTGRFDTVLRKSFYNLYAIGEYRNRTRNQLWDMEAKASLYLNGWNAGDYEAYISLQRMLGKKAGYLNIGFQNVNRSPSFVFDPMSRFPIQNRTNYRKENLIRFFANYVNPRSGWKLWAEYFAVNNYLYFDSFFSAKQEATLFNVLHLSAEKKIRLSRHWNWYAEFHVQQTTGQPPVNLPFFLTRQRIAFEGNFYTNLFISTGLEIRYNTPYKADSYSPFVGRYFYQNTETISNRPDIHAFLHFRIKSFKGFLRVENLNTLNPRKGFEFSKLNMVSGLYPNNGLWMRFGIWWNFVN